MGGCRTLSWPPRSLCSTRLTPRSRFPSSRLACSASAASPSGGARPPPAMIPKCHRKCAEPVSKDYACAGQRCSPGLSNDREPQLDNHQRCTLPRRNVDVNSDAAAAFKSASYQGNYADLNFWITMLQGGVLGCALVACHVCALAVGLLPMLLVSVVLPAMTGTLLVCAGPQRSPGMATATKVKPICPLSTHDHIKNFMRHCLRGPPCAVMTMTFVPMLSRVCMHAQMAPSSIPTRCPGACITATTSATQPCTVRHICGIPLFIVFDRCEYGPSTCVCCLP